MTEHEFVIWLKGFVSASNNFNLTPAAWQELKDQLKTVNTPNTSYQPYTTGGNDDIKEF